VASIVEHRVVWDSGTTSLRLQAERIAARFVPRDGLDATGIRTAIDAILNGQGDPNVPAIASYVLDEDIVAMPVSGRPAEALAVVEPLVTALHAVGIGPERIRLVCDAADTSAYRERLPETLIVESHDPEAEERSGYLANTRGGSRVYLNRTILDSDVTLPVIVADPVGEGPTKGFLAGFWPHFSRSETRAKMTAAFRDDSARVRREIAEVPWLAGVHGAIVALPGAGGPAEVLVVPPMELQHRVYERLDRLWGFEIEDSTDSALLMSASPEGLDIVRFRNVLKLAQKLAAAGHRRVALSLRLDRATLDRLESETEARDERNGLLLKSLMRLGQSANVSFLGNLPDEIADECDIVLMEEPGDLEREVNRFGRWLVVAEAWGARAHAADQG
jgi:hypothetical protein